MQFYPHSKFLSKYFYGYSRNGKKNTIALLLLFFSLIGYAQENKEIEVSGYFIDKETGKKLSDVLIVNEKTRKLMYAEAEGDFTFRCLQKDVLIFSAQGYASMLFTLKDSVEKPNYFITPTLERYKILIAPVVVTADRELQQITDELKLVNAISRNIETENLAPVSNPISYFYTRYNKKEQSKRKVARLKSEYRKRILLKELLNKYMRYDKSIKMNTEELDDFVYSLDLSYNALNYTNKYQLLTSLKKAYMYWKDTKQTVPPRR